MNDTEPRTPVERVAKRAAIREHYLAEAEYKAGISSRSLKSSGQDGVEPPRHSGNPNGCRNDGSGCLCECHDE